MSPLDGLKKPHSPNAQMAEAVLEVMDWPLLVVDVHGNSLYMNKSFEALRSQHEGIGGEARIYFRNREATATLKKVLEQCRAGLEQPSNRNKTRHFHVSFDDVLPPLQVTCKPVPGMISILITIRLIENVSPTPQTGAVLMDVYRLTHAEAACACYMARGLSCQQVAQLRRVSAETVRSQFKAVRRKLGVSTTGEAIARILSFVQPLPGTDLDYLPT